ncbi:fructose-bisphosphate aldolase [Mycoplasmopsis arginini]|uniref:class II fructose-bisphosphate aldolase n=1 Tax=Mycoplasmopsis arginini TaxID=2094 RepID=UPI000D614650|nr:class II fructose-bisphosphate aldolase [Mycoplasmopsis arginini]PWC09146.1 fructose-bisphosphate aldolase [Mycoplasmopsis arginini]
MLVNAKEILKKAYENKKVVFHININNLEWTKQVLLAANDSNKPIILGVSPSAAKYFGGYNVCYAVVASLIKDLNITTDVCLHLDHGSYEDCLKALEANFTSLMFDGSKMPFEKNLELSKKVLQLCKEKNVSLECEIGRIGGVEDKIVCKVVYTKISEAVAFKEIGIDMLAIGIGNIHGEYPSDWKGINFNLLKEINDAVKMPLVLHGGSGISEEDIRKCISCGITKININTELQIENAKAINEFIINNNIMEDKNYNPRKLYKKANEALYNKAKELLNKF